MQRFAFTIFSAVLVMAGVWWWAREPAPAEVTPAAGEIPRRAAVSPSTAAPPRSQHFAQESGEMPGEETPAAAESDYRARLRESDDYWEFAQAAHAAATQGDPAAQYYLGTALTYCESLYDWYFIEHRPNGAVRHRTLDEALQFTVTRRVFTPDDVRKIQKRCQRLRSASPPPFGNSREWLDAAAIGNFPLAQAQAALHKALQGLQSGAPETARAARDDARRLAFDALRTRDPLVMAQLGDVAANLAGDDLAESRKQRWIWPLAACMREEKCDSMAEWMQLYCNIDTQCQPFETPVDVIRRLAGNDFYEIERRAKELNEKIDAGELEADDIGGSG